MRLKTNRRRGRTTNRGHAAARRALLLCAPLLFIFLNPHASPRAMPTAADSPLAGVLPPPQFQGTTGPVEKKREGIRPVVLRNVRAARHATFDRVVFDFDGDSPPGYRVEYVSGSVRDCGSGRRVRVAGRARLHVRLDPAQAHTDEGQATVAWRERRIRLGVLREMEFSCDFEGQAAVVLGLAARRRFRVLELTNPTRLVVDIKR